MTRFYIAITILILISHNFYADTIEGNQILLLVEPPEKSVKQNNEVKSTWSIVNDDQKNAFERVLNRSKVGRSKILQKLFSKEVTESKVSEPIESKKSNEKAKFSQKENERYFQIYNQDWRRSENQKFSPDDFGPQITTPAQFMDVPEYHFNKDIDPKEPKRIDERLKHTKRGAYRFQNKINRLFKKAPELLKKQKYKIDRDTTKIAVAKASNGSRKDGLSFSNAKELQIQQPKDKNLVMVDDVNAKTVLPSLKSPKSENSLWSVGFGLRSGRDKGQLDTYKNEVALQLARNTSKGDQWFMEWARANKSAQRDSKFETLGIGFKKFFNGYNDDRSINPYVALMVENWRGKLNKIHGVNLREGSQNKLIPVARVGMEYKLNAVSNLDLHLNSGGNYMKFTDVTGHSFQVKSHHSSLGMGINYEF